HIGPEICASLHSIGRFSVQTAVMAFRTRDSYASFFLNLLGECPHAILRYLASVFPGVADHWYPADLFTRAKIESILDWHHSNLRRGAATLVMHTALAPFLGLTTSHEAVKQAEKLVMQSLGVIESVWLKGDAKFLLGSPQPSIADLSLVCEIMQLEIFGDEVRDRFLGAHERILVWMDKVKKATSPHFEEAHELLFQVKK
ncbi:hypothetical protein ACJX0J_027453, partial [Zea mays]